MLSRQDISHYLNVLSATPTAGAEQLCPLLHLRRGLEGSLPEHCADHPGESNFSSPSPPFSLTGIIFLLPLYEPRHLFLNISEGFFVVMSRLFLFYTYSPPSHGQNDFVDARVKPSSACLHRFLL